VCSFGLFVDDKLIAPRHARRYGYQTEYYVRTDPVFLVRDYDEAERILSRICGERDLVVGASRVIEDYAKQVLILRDFVDELPEHDRLIVVHAELLKRDYLEWVLFRSGAPRVMFVVKRPPRWLQLHFSPGVRLWTAKWERRLCRKRLSS